MSVAQANGHQGEMFNNLASLECIKELYLDPNTADAFFVIKSQRIPVHKTLLAAVSNVFKAMFYGPLRETGDVELNDVSVDAFKIFLKFFYLRRVRLTDKYIVELLHLGHKYNVAKCVEACDQILKKTVNDDNVCTSLNLAILSDHTDLLELCRKHLILNTETVLKSSNFLECEKKVLEYILQMDVLSCSEKELFKACMSWVKVKSKNEDLTREMVQTHLGDLFYEIRFKSMPMQDLATLANTYDSVLSPDFKDIINMISLPEYQPTRYSTKLRRATWNESAIITCDPAIKTSKRCDVDLCVEEYTTFSSNQPLLLGGFICEEIFYKLDKNKKSRLDLSIDVTITQITDEPDKVILEMRTNIGSRNHEVSLPSPVLIKPGLQYEICLSKFPDGFSHYSKQLLTEVKIDSDVTITFHGAEIDATTDETIIALISALKFNKL